MRDGRLLEARGARSLDLRAAAATCAAGTTGRTSPWPTPPSARSGLTPAQAVAGLPSFRGPAAPDGGGRARRRACVWVNDSKATNPDSAEKSLVSFANIFWIAGGKPKPGGFRSLRPALGNVRAGYLIGTAAAEIAADLGDLVPMHQVGTLEAAVRAASAAARAERCRRGRRAAGAGLRLLRPVRQFRGARRRVPRPRPGRGRRRMIFVPRTDRSIVGNWWWTVDRTMLAGVGDPGADRHWS